MCVVVQFSLPRFCQCKTSVRLVTYLSLFFPNWWCFCKYNSLKGWGIFFFMNIIWVFLLTKNIPGLLSALAFHWYCWMTTLFSFWKFYSLTKWFPEIFVTLDHSDVLTMGLTATFSASSLYQAFSDMMVIWLDVFQEPFLHFSIVYQLGR